MCKLFYKNQDICLNGNASSDTVSFVAASAADCERLGVVALNKHMSRDGRPYGMLIFELLPHFCRQRWYEAVLEIAEKHFFEDFDLSLLLCEVDPETDQEKIAALVSYGFDPDREHITDIADMFVLERQS